MGILTKSDQYLCIDKLTLDKRTESIYAEVKIYNNQSDRLQGSPLSVFSHNRSLTHEVWQEYFGAKLDQNNPYKLAYDYLKTLDKSFSSGLDV